MKKLCDSYATPLFAIAGMHSCAIKWLKKNMSNN